MYQDPEALKLECLEAAGEHVPEEHKPKYDMAMNFYKNPNEAAKDAAMAAAEAYISPKYMGDFTTGLAYAGQAYEAGVELKKKKDEM